MKKSLSIEEFLETRPDITPEMLEEGRLLVEAKIKGYELQQARKACGMTQKEVAAKMGVSQKRISDLENGSIDVMQVETLRRYITSLGGTLEITAKLPGVSLELQVWVPIIRSSSKRRAPWRRTDGGDRLDQRRSSRFRCAAGRRWYGNAARCGFIVIRYLFVVFIQHVGIIKTATNEPLIEMVRYLGRRGEYPRRTRKASCRTRSRFSRGSAG
mgnify:CR=1 FL=1